jgi:hypothetical protein
MTEKDLFFLVLAGVAAMMFVTGLVLIATG